MTKEQAANTKETVGYYGESEDVKPYDLLMYEWQIPASHVLDYGDCSNLGEEAENFALSANEKTGRLAGKMTMEFHGQTIYGTWQLD